MKSILALLADWANGIFSILLVSYFYGIQPEWWYFVIGILLSHVPDLDVFPGVMQHGKVMAASADHVVNHREGLHYPLVLLFLASIGVYLFGFWGWVLFTNIALHFINDAYGTGWGVKFLWPFSDKNYKFFARRVNQPKAYLISTEAWDAVPPKERVLKFITFWSSAELPDYMRRWGMPDWIDHYYLRLNPTGVVEYSLFIVAVILMIATIV